MKNKKHPIAGIVAHALKDEMNYDKTFEIIKVLFDDNMLNWLDESDKITITEFVINKIPSYRLIVEKENEKKYLEDKKLKLEVKQLEFSLNDYKLTKVLAWIGAIASIIGIVLSVLALLNQYYKK